MPAEVIVLVQKQTLIHKGLIADGGVHGLFTVGNDRNNVVLGCSQRLGNEGIAVLNGEKPKCCHSNSTD